jgi:hypothetical protein
MCGDPAKKILRMTTEIRVMTSEQVSVFNDKCETVSQEDLKSCFNKRETETETISTECSFEL